MSIFKKINVICFAVCSFFYFSVEAQESSFLHQIPTDTNEVSTGLEPLKNQLDSINVVLTGENHRFYAINQHTKFKMIRFLHQFGFRYLTIEFGSGIGYLANDYVLNGNEKAADILTENFKGNRSAFVEMLGLIKRLNETQLSEADKIKIRGIDYTRFPFYSTRALGMIIEKKECEQELKDYYEDLNVVSSGNANIDAIGFSTRGRAPNFDIRYSFKTYENRIYELSIRNLVKDFYSDTSSFIGALGDKYFDFKRIIDDLKETVEWYKGEGISIQSHTKRERKMATAMMKIFENDSLAKVYGQFGRCHIRNENYEQNCYGFDLTSLSERLKNNNLGLKALNIPIFYLQDRDFESNKKVSGKRTNQLFDPAKMYLYDSGGDEVKFSEKFEQNEGFIILNTFASRASYDDVLSEEEIKYPSRIGYYSGEGGEGYFSVENQLGIYDNTVNEDFSTDIIDPQHHFIGFSLKSVDYNRLQIGYRFLMTVPNHSQSDSSEFRYTHFRHDFNLGYNIIHNRIFSWYTDLNFILGFAKIRERTFPAEQVFTVPAQSEQIQYRNFYYAGAVSSGLRFKLGEFSINLEASYLRDFSNPDWRVRGTPVPEISRLNFSDFLYSLGVGVRL